MLSITSKPLITIHHTGNVNQAIKIMSEHNIRRLIVIENEKPIGVITQKKIIGNVYSLAFEIPELEIPDRIRCPYCSSLFDTKEKLSKHIEQIHIGIGIFQGYSNRINELGSISSPDRYPKSI